MDIAAVPDPRWGVLLPTFDPLGTGPPPVVAAARRAEALGFDAVWAADHLLSPAPVLDGLCSLAAAAAVTERVQLGMSVLLLALRSPAWTAKQLATIDALAPGRLRIGVGVGGEYPEEFVAAGADLHTRGRDLDRLLAVLPALLQGEPVEQDGTGGGLHVGGLRPPLRVLPPISVGGRSDAALRRAVRFGDQWLGMWRSPAGVGKAALRLAELADREGRPVPSVAMLVQASVDGDEDEARRAAADMVAGQFALPFDTVERWTPYGRPERVARALTDYVEAGVGEFVLMPGGRDPLDCYERFADVRERVRADLAGGRGR